MTESVEPPFDPILMRLGDSRNVIDKYKMWEEDAIIADLDLSRSPLHVAVENWERDINIGTITRTANAFNVSGFHIVGEKKWNRRGAMATYRYIQVFHHDSMSEFDKFCQTNRLHIIGIDNCEQSTSIENVTFPRDSVLIFGNEGFGLTDEAIKYCENIYDITMYGSTRSLNSSVAAGIAMYHWQLNHVS